MNWVSTVGFLWIISLKNRALQLKRKLSSPRYLVGGAVWGMYMFSVIGRGSLGKNSAMAPKMFMGGFLVFTLLQAMGAWIWGGDEQSLRFTEAEVQFLMGGPLSRPQMLHYRMLKSLLVSGVWAMLFSLISGRWSIERPFLGLGLFFGLSLMSLHGTAASLTRLGLRQKKAPWWQRAAVIAGVLAVISLSVTYIGLDLLSRFVTLVPEAEHLHLFLQPVKWLVYPLVQLTQLFFATTFTEGIWALLWAMGLLAVHYLWVMRVETAFEEEAADAALRRSVRIEKMRSGKFFSSRLKKVRSTGTLSIEGSPQWGLVWKNYLAMRRLWSLWSLLIVAILMVSGGVIAVKLATQEAGTFAAMIALTPYLMVGLLGPTMPMAAFDLRIEMENFDVLRQLPLSGEKIVAAELVVPTVFLTAVQIGSVVLSSVAMFLWSGHEWPANRIITVALALILIGPALTLPRLLLRNGLTVVFPEWAAAMQERRRGMEVGGMRLIVMFGELLVGGLALLPAAAVGFVLFWLVKDVVGFWLWPMVGLMGLFGAIGETWLGVKLIGELFDRPD